MSDDGDDKQELVNLGQVARRVDAVKHVTERQAEMISEIVREALALDVRVRSLEGLAQTRAITEAREDERDKALYDRLGRIEKNVEGFEGVSVKVATLTKDVDSIKGGVSKILWTIVLTVVAAIAGFAIKGGFS